MNDRLDVLFGMEREIPFGRGEMNGIFNMVQPRNECH
jgi:hypothetical protein